MPPTESTTTPIKHVIVIIGENRTFDHVFATYQPDHGETVSNLLSKGHRQLRTEPRAQFLLGQPVCGLPIPGGQISDEPSRQRRLPVLPPVLAGGYTTPPFPDVANRQDV